MGKRIAKPVISFWARNFLWCELVFVAALFAALLIWAKKYNGEGTILDYMANRRGLVYATLSAIFGSLLGFAIAAESIVLALSGSDKLTVVRNSKHYPTLWRVFRWTIRTLAFATISAVTALILDRDANNWTLWLYACSFFALLAVAQIGRTIWVLEQVVNVVSATKKED